MGHSRFSFIFQLSYFRSSLLPLASKAAMKIQTLGGNINMDWSRCGNYIAVGNKSDYLVVVDVRTGNQLKKKKFHYEVTESFFYHLLLKSFLS